MVSNTRDKLLEAKYFFNCMNKVIQDSEKFKHNLSAFISAFRSVTLFMQTEFSKIEGFKEWYAKKQEEMRNDKYMALLNKKRRMTIHLKPLDPFAHVNVTIEEQILLTESIGITITHENGEIEKRKLGSNGEWETVTVNSERNKNVNNNIINQKKGNNKVTANQNPQMEWRWYFKELPEEDIITISINCLNKLESIVDECENLFNV